MHNFTAIELQWNCPILVTFFINKLSKNSVLKSTWIWKSNFALIRQDNFLDFGLNISPILTQQRKNSITKLTLMVRRKGCPKGARACQMLFRVRLVQLDRAVQMHTVRIFINCGSVQKVSNAMIDNWLGKSDLVPFWQPAVKVNWTFFLTFFFSFLIADFSLERSHKKTCETKTHEILTECLLAHLLWTTRRRASYFPVCRWIVMTASSFFPRKACMYNIKFAFRFKL